MDRQDVLKRLLYPKCKSAIEFQFDSLLANPLLSYITVQDIAQLYKIATSLKYSSKPKEKYIMIDKIMTNRGFKKMASGTNRVTYRCLNDYSIVIKIAIDKVGLSDNGNEFRNQQFLKPFVTKCFEVSPCGTVGLFERVVPITSREEFINISDDIFDLINNLIGKYVLEDIGEKFYMNYGLREGFGPVLLDYPYVFELDGRKLRCNVPEPFDPKGYCGGEIDYDLGYNDLVCKKCGKRYLATELKSDKKSDKPKIIIEGEDIVMKCVLKRGDEIVSSLNSEEPIATNTIKSVRDFSRLKATVTTEVEEKKEVAPRKPVIKTNDEIHLKVKLRGKPTSKDIDREAREKEEILEKNSEKISVSFDSIPEEKPVEDDSKFSVSLNVAEDEKEPQPAETAEAKEPEPTEKVEENYLEPEEFSNPFIEVFINNDGEIIDVSKNAVIGYTKEYFDNFEASYIKTEEQEAVDKKEDEPKSDEKTDEDTSVAYSDPDSTTTIGDIVGSTFGSKNKNYRTSDIVSPIEGYFSSSEKKPVDQEDKKEIPDVIIHRREEDEEDIPQNDEEYDPEYSDTEEDEDDSTTEENELDLY